MRQNVAEGVVPGVEPRAGGFIRRQRVPIPPRASIATLVGGSTATAHDRNLCGCCAGGGGSRADVKGIGTGQTSELHPFGL